MGSSWVLHPLDLSPLPPRASFYLKAKHQLHRGPPGQDAVIGMADEEEVQNTQQAHKGCGDPQKWGLVGSAQGLRATSSSMPEPTHKPPGAQAWLMCFVESPHWEGVLAQTLGALGLGP